MTGPLRVLGAAASCSELAFVYLEAGDLTYWGVYRRAARDIESAGAMAGKWIDKFEPMLVIVPHYGKTSRKGVRARGLVEAVIAVADASDVVCIRAEQPKPRRNKYEYAARLAVIFPQLASRVPPPRRAWDSERRGIVLFEALAVAHDWLWRNTEDTSELPN